MTRTCLTIILAAGKGTRMKSDLPKVLHPVGGLPMVMHAINAAKTAGTDKLAIVTGHGSELLDDALKANGIDAQTCIQKEQLGTANAVDAARSVINEGFDDVIVMFGDTPLVRPETLIEARAKLEAGVDVVVIGFETENPFGYGRLVVKDGQLTAIVEEKEANEEERAITFCNGGLMAFNGRTLGGLLDKIDNNNAKGEFYLTDAVAVANTQGLQVEAMVASEEDVLGVNNRAELANVEQIWQQRVREKHLLDGVTMTAPHTVFFHHDTKIEAGVIIEPNVFFGPNVSVEKGAKIRAFSHLEGASVGANAEVGPFARLRPGANLSEKSKVGNFCEVKNADIAQGAKVNHLTYIGDASIGAGANIGAGTITCNYDGMNKFKTTIGEGAFIGSNSSLVAPVTINDNAYIASGSVITNDVPKDAVGFGRARQETKPGLAVKLRARIKAIKEASKKV
ncbi:bifunctional UDP-N-acetylglucosamine diphosphorylase/glucosamine-1-phosphate N-acetyltransferase GlmU [Ahrensia marina]|uniref:Bifunctional protein GlmU n=1 Tax=Ahrensia marina TaxID=1514904 RepID=A0A0N0E7N4_9HYPH|nr:bifunctional UDP-N-acetylglucosamine diphosphorylase/glucosamine-1-phosphate N-acetyltransferase GlmU [Ahrensia marina]KPB01388.1 bifunctional N-acetylglucosamine-1-phosphate uridyltransferase/glucosamine-1-phosphate acetyltransferase [Ahrensia marina]